MITETFYKNNKLYYVESKYVEGSTVYVCVNVSDEDDVIFLPASTIQELINPYVCYHMAENPYDSYYTTYHQCKLTK